LNFRSTQNISLLNTAYILSLITIFYNIVEGAISTGFGTKDETLVLFGFGVDSFVEVISGLGIGHMIWRMKRYPIEKQDEFEKRALMITGLAFYLLTAGLAVGATLNIVQKAQPNTTLVGIIVSSISIFTMYFLYKKKLSVGEKLKSSPIVSDAKCTKTCLYLSFILLGSSLIYEMLKIPYIDAAGSLGIAWYALKEGKEAFEKAKTGQYTCTNECS
jgi:hypothetical protein